MLKATAVPSVFQWNKTNPARRVLVRIKGQSEPEDEVECMQVDNQVTDTLCTGNLFSSTNITPYISCFCKTYLV